MMYKLLSEREKHFISDMEITPNQYVKTEMVFNFIERFGFVKDNQELNSLLLASGSNYHEIPPRTHKLISNILASGRMVYKHFSRSTEEHYYKAMQKLVIQFKREGMFMDDWWRDGILTYRHMRTDVKPVETASFGG